MKIGLRFRFIIAISVSIILFAGFFIPFFVSQQRKLLTDELRNRGEILSQNLAKDSEYGVLTEDRALLTQLIRNVRHQEDIVYVEIMDIEGKILTDYYPKGNPLIPLDEKDLDMDETNIQYTTSSGGESVFDFLVPVWVQKMEEEESDLFIEKEQKGGSEVEETKTEKIGFVRVGISLKSTYRNINHLRDLSILTIGIAYILLAIIFTLFLNYVVIKPLRRLSRGAGAFATGNLDKRIEITRSDEIGQLTYSFNQMAENLKSDIEIIKNSKKKLQEYSEELEDKVKARTKELEEINIKLLESIENVKERTSELEKKSFELEQANIRLQEADRLKSVFLASMSHELRTPLNSIIGFTGIILQGLPGEINEEQKKQLTMVKNSANHLLRLINEILDVSKIEAGKVEIFPEEFGLTDVIREVVETLTPRASKKGLEILTDVPEGNTLFSDKGRLKQVLLNLLANAVKFTDQGSVKIAAKIIDNKNLEIRVIDTGIGIKKEDMNKLFLPFQQIDMSSTKSYEGTGLGLYLSKKLVTILGGIISAKSEYGKGSEFIFTIPLKFKENR